MGHKPQTVAAIERGVFKPLGIQTRGYMVRTTQRLRMAVTLVLFLLPVLAHVQTVDRFSSSLTSDEQKDLFFMAGERA
jgi:hypothetical protein